MTQQNLCVICNKEILNKDSRAMYCSKQCKATRDNAARKKVQAVKNCLTCGKEIVPERSTKKFCSNKCKDDNKTRKMTRWLRIEKYYGLTEQEWTAILESQNNVCAICNRKSKVWHTDHDHRCCPAGRHTCGKCVRGILCNRCNQAIGLLKEDKDNFKRAVEYLS